MSFKRKLLPDQFPKGDELTRQLVSIGFGFAENKSKVEPNIEDALIGASTEGINGDFRTLSLLVDWIPIHLKQLNIDRLNLVVREMEDEKLRAFWSAIARWQKKDPRMTKLRRVYRGPQILILPKEEIQFHLKRSGEDERFVKSSLLVPANMLRRRSSDISEPTWVAKHHLAYRFRVIIGPTYRADMWATLEKDSTLGPSELARRCYGSFATAWNVKQDWSVIKKVLGYRGARRRLKGILETRI